MADERTINEIWYVPALKRQGYRKLLVYYEYMSPTRKGAVSNIIMNSYSGAYDWAYRRKLGWSIERVTVSNGDRETHDS